MEPFYRTGCQPDGEPTHVLGSELKAEKPVVARGVGDWAKLTRYWATTTTFPTCFPTDPGPSSALRGLAHVDRRQPAMVGSLQRTPKGSRCDGARNAAPNEERFYESVEAPAGIRVELYGHLLRFVPLCHPSFGHINKYEGNYQGLVGDLE